MLGNFVLVLVKEKTDMKPSQPKNAKLFYFSENRQAKLVHAFIVVILLVECLESIPFLHYDITIAQTGCSGQREDGKNQAGENISRLDRSHPAGGSLERDWKCERSLEREEKREMFFKRERKTE